MVQDNAEMLAARFRMAVDLHLFGVALMRQNLRRRNPDADEAAIDEALSQWLVTRPGAERGDCPGVARRPSLSE